MKVKILRVETNAHVNANINEPQRGLSLPSITDGWRFNFKKHAQKQNVVAYILTCEDTPSMIEGCLIFEMRGKVEPYMAYIEIAPHNKGGKRMYDYIAGCLIAFACRLSIKNGKGDYKGWLAFDVLEENENDTIKLMKLFSTKYRALRFGDITMLIPPKEGEELINEFLKR